MPYVPPQPGSPFWSNNASAIGMNKVQQPDMTKFWNWAGSSRMPTGPGNDPSLNASRGFGSINNYPESLSNKSNKPLPTPDQLNGMMIVDYQRGATGPQYVPLNSYGVNYKYNPADSPIATPAAGLNQTTSPPSQYGPFQSQLPNQGQFASSTPQNPFQLTNTQQNPFQSPQQGPFGVNQYYPLSNYYNPSPSGGTGNFQQY
jgi:hypothetical protein